MALFPGIDLKIHAAESAMIIDTMVFDLSSCYIGDYIAMNSYITCVAPDQKHKRRHKDNEMSVCLIIFILMRLH